jgi:hypothetical protein
MTAKAHTHRATKPEDDATSQSDSDTTKGVHKMSDPIETTKAKAKSHSAPNAADEDPSDQDLFDNVPL